MHDRGVASFFMNRKLFTKVFLSISLVSFLGIFALMAAHHQYFQRTMLDNELKQVQRAINQAALNLDNRLNRIVNSMYYFFSYSEEGTKLLTVDLGDEREVELARSALGAFRMQNSDDLDSAFLLIRDHAAGGQETLIHDSDLSRIREKDFREHPWYRDFVRRQMSLWSAPTDDHLFFQDRSLYTVYLTVSRFDEGGRDGILVARLNGKMFSDAFRLLAGSDLGIELRDAAGRLLYTSFPRIAEQDSDRYVGMTTKLDYSGFQVRAFVNKASILEKVKKVRILHPLILVFILLMTLGISFVLSLTLSRPIRRLLSLMKSVEKGDLNVRFPTRYKDEIGILGIHFNKMIASLNELIRQIYAVQQEKLIFE